VSKERSDATDLTTTLATTTELAQVLFILIPAAWLAIAMMVLAVCVMAARGDANMVRTGSASPTGSASGDANAAGVVSERPREALAPREVVIASRPRRIATRPARPRHRPLRGRDVRGRGARSAAES
jgi:hypothetical protein